MTSSTGASVALPPRERVLSVDVFRGLTIGLMVFVIAIGAGDYRNLPQTASWFGSLPVSLWNHAEVGWERFAEEQRAAGLSEEQIQALPETRLRNVGLTVTDLVAPFFVFIVGLAIPLSRSRRGDGWWHHVLSRTGWLILAGVLYISLILGLSWWWGILQAIGVAYFMGAASLKLPPRARPAAIALVLAIHTAMSLGTDWWLHFGEGPLPFWTIAQIHGDWAKPLTVHCRPWASISYGAMTMIGVLLGQAIATGERRRIIRSALWIALPCMAAGYAIHEAGLAWGVTELCFNKPDVSASYALFSSGAGALTFLLLYWVLDVRRVVGWSFILREFGKNALLAYFMQVIMRLAFRALGIEPLFAGSPNDMLRAWASIWDHTSWSAFLLDKTGMTGLAWALIWTACLWLIVVGCNRRGIVWKL